MKKLKSKKKQIEGLFFVLTTICCCTPMLGNSIILIGLIMMAFIIIFMNGNIIMRNDSSLTKLIVIYLAIIFTYKATGLSDAVWGRYFVYTYIELQVLMMLIIPQKFINLKQVWVWWAMSIIIGINILWNIYMMYLNPELSAVYHIVDPEVVRSFNVGMSDFHVLSLLFFDICFFVFLNTSIKNAKYASLLLSIVAGTYIVGFCFKASVVVFFILSLVVLLIVRRTKEFGPMVILVGVLSIITMSVISTYSDEIIRLIIDYSPSNRLTGKLIMLVDANDAEASEGSFNARADLWYNSVFTWLESVENFLFGVGDHWGNLNSGIGQHSEFLDLLAKYGILGGSIMCAILILSIKFIFSVFEKKYYPQLLMIILTFIACGMTKRVFYSSVGVAVYLLLPLSALLVNKKHHSHIRIK